MTSNHIRAFGNRLHLDQLKSLQRSPSPLLDFREEKNVKHRAKGEEQRKGRWKGWGSVEVDRQKGVNTRSWAQR